MDPNPSEEEPTYFRVTRPDDAGQPIPNIELPKEEPQDQPFEPLVPVPGQPGPPPDLAAPKPAAAERRERLAEMRDKQKARARRSFLIGLMAGQAVILAASYGLPLLNKAGGGMRIDLQKLPILICMGVLAGIALTALVIFLMLLGSGLVGLFKGGSVTRGILRTLRAVGAIVLTTAILGGTAFFLMPRNDWGDAHKKAWSMVQEGWRKFRAAR